MKRKGFTLVELLAVIVILALIALIAVPMIVGVIEKSRRGALQNSGYGLVEAGNLYNAQYQNPSTARFDIKDNEITTEEENKLTYKGTIKEGTVLINNKGKVVVCINDGKYAAYKNFDDNKVTIVDNKTCTVPENSNIVYLDNEATIDINVTELLSRIEELETKVSNLENEKVSGSDVTNFMNNLTTTHNSDISSINTRLEALTQILNNKNNFHGIDNESLYITSSTDLAYTGVSTTIPANSYYCVTAVAVFNNSMPLRIQLRNEAGNYASDSGEVTYSESLETTHCGITDTEDRQLKVYAKYSGPYQNRISLTGFYVNK